MPNNCLKTIAATDEDQWMNVLRAMPRYDFYHLPRYHQLATEQYQGKAVLFVYSEDSHVIALPLLLRPIPDVTGGLESTLIDATSVYGYAGPIATPKAERDQGFLERFYSALSDEATNIGVVSVFSRLHPVISNQQLIEGLGTVVPMGETISIELAASVEQQTAHYRKSHRYEIRRARSLGMKVLQTDSDEMLMAFQNLYLSTMDRVGASKRYYFDPEYFQRMKRLVDSELRLFYVEWHGELCSAALFMRTCDLVQYHLSASDPRFAKYAPTKLLIDEARLWAASVGARYLHLGGGVGSQQDQLFQMKSGFSNLRHRFCVWNWVVDPNTYEYLVQRHVSSDTVTDNRQDHNRDFFPLYR